MDVPDISWRALLMNEAFWLALTAWVLSGLIKVLVTLVTDKKLLLVRMIGTGGMPSTHTAPVIGLTTAVGLIYGLAHPLFAFGVLLSFVVMYDAANLRQEAGKHAEAINILFEELISGGGIHREKWQKMTELLGHTWKEIAAGGLVGFFTALLGHHLWGIYVVGS